MSSRNNKSPNESETQATRSCPICGKPQVQTFRPFCSKRCADVDLHRWLSGAYVVAGESNSQKPEDSDETAED
ncbi:DNA gyrase inhibitor YacG [Beijerinckia indica]|uniref:DNA gyrase inhibitor YacG n=1 Tax=Beijerinckia indica subsp. indica (strain ATCC 9039 / DSM 1715 / NCIMB 8712) TaxID=395963 RepID=B2IC50_BEII9|nr:DNA gyrase inhibitor YacG [Beijerinckia indica]ACB95305.1 protein of unknown function DUF329 [Beijerinckia indica subsp. indica ATCC 9039]